MTTAGRGDVLFCHATPRNDTDILTRAREEAALLPVFDKTGVPLLVGGHAHLQFLRRVGSTQAVNAGGVGMSFSEPGAYWSRTVPALSPLVRPTT
jgi:predicted phosphodiesterase